jgi:hypothetical protein
VQRFGTTTLLRSVEIRYFRVREIVGDGVRPRVRRLRCRSPPSCTTGSRRQQLFRVSQPEKKMGDDDASPSVVKTAVPGWVVNVADARSV